MTSTESAYFKACVPAAQSGMKATGVPASVTLAQGICESGWMLSQLAKVAKNLFGIKAAHNAAPNSYVEFKTEEWLRGRKIVELAAFAKYGTEADCFAAHGTLLSKASRYAPAMKVKSEVQAFCVQLQACGYSTSRDPKTGRPDYADKLMKLVHQYNLTQYDGLPEPEPIAPAKEAV